MAGELEKQMLEHIGATNARLEEGNRRLAGIESTLDELRRERPFLMTRSDCDRIHQRDGQMDTMAVGMAQIAQSTENVATMVKECRNGIVKGKRSPWPQTVQGWVALTLAVLALFGFIAGGVVFGHNLTSLVLAAQNPPSADGAAPAATHKAPLVPTTP